MAFCVQPMCRRIYCTPTSMMTGHFIFFTRVLLSLAGLLFLLGNGVPASAAALPEPVAMPAAASLISPGVPDWVQTPLSVDPAASSPIARGAPSSSATRIHLLESQIEVGSRSEFNHYAYRIETEAGLQMGGQISLDFAPAHQTVRWHFVRIWHQGVPREVLTPGILQVLRQEENAERFLYHGRMTALALLNDVRVGDIVETAYTRIGTNPVFGDRYSTTLIGSSSTPIDRLFYRIIEAPGRPLHIATLGDFKPVLKTVAADGRTVHSWTGQNIAQVNALLDAPPDECQYSYAQVTDFTSWKDVRNWAQSLFDPMTGVSTELSAQVQPLLAVCKSIDEKADVLLRFVQDDIRYLGLHFNESTHRPTPPLDVLSRRFGDCKDKSLLLTVLLRGIGLEADVALVSSTWQRGVAGLQPSPLAFDHAIVRVRRPSPEAFSTKPTELSDFSIGAGFRPMSNVPEPEEISMRISRTSSDSYLWLDPTLTLQGGRWDRRNIPDYGYALVLSDSSESLSPVTSPASADGMINLREIYTINDYTSPVKLELTTVYEGASADDYRYFSRVSDPARYTQQITGFLARFYPKITSVRPIQWEDNREANILTARSEYEIGDFWVTDAGNHYRSIEFYPWSLADRLPRPETINRNVSFSLPHRQTYAQNTTVFLPKDWPASTDQAEIDDDAFAFHYSVNGEGRRVDLAYQWRSFEDAVSPGRLEAWGKKMAAVRATFGYKLQQNIRLADAVKKTGLVWSLIAAGVSGLLAGAIIGWLFYRWTPAPRPPPLDSAHLDGISGWLGLLALGVVLRPLAQLFLAKDTIALMGNLPSWITLTDKESISYQPAFAWVGWTETFIQGLLFTWSLVMCVQFFKRRPSLPAAMSSLFALLIAWEVGRPIIVSVFLPTAMDTLEPWPKIIGRSTGMGLWIVYLLRSRRVRMTFRTRRG
jgi:transglutaminase-like putative cysteine protease